MPGTARGGSGDLGRDRPAGGVDTLASGELLRRTAGGRRAVDGLDHRQVGQALLAAGARRALLLDALGEMVDLQGEVVLLAQAVLGDLVAPPGRASGAQAQ